MSPRLLVLTTVHHPDDNRIREKTIRSLGSRFDVTLAARDPGPADDSGLTWIRLRGGRLRRNVTAWRTAFRGRFDVVSIHDPELIPLGIALELLTRSRVVIDVHEDIPAQIATKEWLPRPIRRPIALIMGSLLRLAERTCAMTLAEPSYGHVFRRQHPVIRNHPAVEHLPTASGDGEGVVYVGDVTVARGALDAVVACGRLGLRLVLVGPVQPGVERDIRRVAEESGTQVELTGRLPHRQAMERVAGAAVTLSPLHDVPNYRQSIPTKILEYLSVGVPVVASDLPATRELVEGLDAVMLYPPGDVDGLAAAIRSLHDGEAVQIARNQSPAVRERFRWNDDEVVALYEAFLERMSG